MRGVAPYQIFFPLGLLNALLSVGVWTLQSLAWEGSPPILVHSRLIAGGFLWSFILGFLMTALPRMTGTPSANRREYILSFILLVNQSVLSWPIDGRFFYANQILLILFLIVYGARRLLNSTRTIPVFFSHVGLAVLLALAGSYFHFSGNSFLGIHLYHVGATLLLILGIGTRFFSFLAGLNTAFEMNPDTRPHFVFHGLGVLTVVLLFLAGSGFKLAYLGLTIISLVYLFYVWKVQRMSDRPSALKFGVRIVALTIPTSFFLVWLQPMMYLTWFHLLFLGTFSLMTFAVATRVVLAHGAYSTDLELRSPALWCLVIFLILGIAARILYGFSGGPWKTGFLYGAVVFWILGVGSWCLAFFPKIFIPGPRTRPSCG